jgi:DNA-directed RNA polymerase subunit RPC12/RpoP
MKAPRFLKSETLSKCHSAPSLLVRSRDGGFISQNCLKCGHSSYVSIDQLPKLKCEFCLLIDLEVGKNDDGNYQYKCQGCGRKWNLPEMLPHWSELFSYCGLYTEMGQQ